ncbi:MAG: heme-binding protein [Bryobacteraceae bacterium]
MSTSNPAPNGPAGPIYPSVRISPANDAISKDLGLLAELAGTWHGKGFNLIARPDGLGGQPLFLELNQTDETLRITEIGSDIPNRGDGVADIDLFGLTYLQKISDSVTGGALHIEPGIWVRLPDDPGLPTQQNVVRMGTIPHGNALLAEGTAILVPSLAGGTFAIAPVNTAPFPQGSPMPAGGTVSKFPEFDLTVPESAANPRTPFGNTPPIPLPASIDGVPMQTVINDPTRLLQAAIKGQNIKQMTVIDIATVANPTGTKPVPGGGGGIENIPFLQTNANAAVVFATFWIETIAHPLLGEFMQLQYVQTVILNFPIVKPPAPPVPFSWPHVSVATLRKTFGGQ